MLNCQVESKFTDPTAKTAEEAKHKAAAEKKLGAAARMTGTAQSSFPVHDADGKEIGHTYTLITYWEPAPTPAPDAAS